MFNIKPKCLYTYTLIIIIMDKISEEYQDPTEGMTEEEISEGINNDYDSRNQQFEEEIKEMENYADEENFQDIIPENYIETSQDTLQKLKSKAREDISHGLKSEFLSYISNFSFGNSLASEIIFHSIFSAITKDLVISVNNKPILNVLHMLLQQDTGTGKGELFTETKNIIKYYNSIIAKPLIIYEADGSESTESYYNSFQHNGKKFLLDKPTTGLFESTDIFLVEECSYIFVEKKGIRASRSEIYLKALEGKELYKALSSWQGKIRITQPNFVFLGSSRLVSEVQEAIVSSGLLQRMIPCFRNVGKTLRDEMNEQNADKLTLLSSNIDGLQTRKQEICKNLLELREWLEKNTIFAFVDEEKINNILKTYLKNWSDLVVRNTDKLVYQSIARGFIARFPKQIRAIAVHNAILRKNNLVSEADFLGACELFDNLLKKLGIWIEESISESKALYFRRKILNDLLKRMFKEKQSYRRNDFVKLVATELEYSEGYSNVLINRLKENGKITMKVVGSDEYVLRGNKA